MDNHHASVTLGDFVTASFDLGAAVAGDTTNAAELAARHLERVLVRGSNLRLTAALAKLAREVGPVTSAPGEARSLVHAVAR
ncbi:MAG TPA: hypothetical protein VHJ20_10525 [Polyangia bacterium]|nr:hypothetical protein [Polyangia bacterium]